MKYTQNITERPRLFVDMDGTLAEWRNIKITFEEEEDTSPAKIMEKLDEVLYLPGYYKTLRPYTSVVSAVKNIIQKGNIEVFTLSCVKEDKNGVSPKQDKDDWLDRYLPEIDKEHRIFVPDGKNKTEYIPGGLRHTDSLLDDYTKNLRDWDEALDKIGLLPKGKAIKLLNDVNESKGTWQKTAVSYESSSEQIAADITDIIEKSLRIVHSSPRKEIDKISHKDFINTYLKFSPINDVAVFSIHENISGATKIKDISGWQYVDLYELDKSNIKTIQDFPCMNTGIRVYCAGPEALAAELEDMKRGEYLGPIPVYYKDALIDLVENINKWNMFFCNGNLQDVTGYQWKVNPEGHIGYTMHRTVFTREDGDKELLWITINPYTKNLYLYIENDSGYPWNRTFNIPEETLTDPIKLECWISDEITDVFLIFGDNEVER